MRRLLTILALLASVSMNAESFKILFLNSESIKIGKVVCKTGDTFNDSEKIFWKDGKQAMKVISLNTKKQYVLVSEDFKKRKMKSAKDFIVKSNRLSTRGQGSLSTVAKQIGTKVYWLDPATVSINYEPDEKEYFFLRHEGRDTVLGVSFGQLTFGSVIWGDTEPRPIDADLFFHYKDGEDVLVSSGIRIIPLPKEIQLRKR